MKSTFLRNNKEYERLSKETADWFLKTKSGSLSPEEEVEFYTWLVENPRHKQKFEVANALWRVSGTEQLANDLREIAELDDLQDELDTSPIRRWYEKIIEKINFHTPVLKYSAMVTAVLAIVLGYWITQPAVFSKGTYHTTTGEQKKIYFSDGSIGILDTESVFSKKYTDESRNIELVKGRAYFSVAKDSSRPFTVTTGKVTALAVGTEFNVYRDDKEKISVTVTEGRVQVSYQKDRLPTGGKSTSIDDRKLYASTYIKAGQEILIDEQQKKKEIRTVDIQKANTWLEGRLYFQDAPLKTVIDEINRYLANKIVIRDYDTGNLNISLNYDIRRHDKFLVTLGKVLPVDYKTDPSGKIYLYQTK